MHRTREEFISYGNHMTLEIEKHQAGPFLGGNLRHDPRLEPET